MSESKYPFWQDGSMQVEKSRSEEQLRVVGEDIIQSEQESELSAIELKAIKAQLTKARTQLILDSPFLGNLVLRLPLIAADSWCKTSATDAKSFYYNPEFIDSLNNHQIKFVLIHEALHCALTHFARRGNRVKHKWDLACDFAINPLLVKEGFHPPIDVPIFRQYEGMIAEEIYPMIDDNLDQEPMDQHLYDDQANDDSKESEGGMREDDLQKEKEPENNPNSKSDNQQGKGAPQLAQQPPILKPDEVEQLATQWQKNLASSAQLAQQAGKLNGEFSKLIDFFLQPQVSWQSLLAQYMTNFARDDFSYTRPSRRSGDAILPSLKSQQVDITIAIDTSGSISQEEVNEFISEVDAIKSNLRASITLLACDDTLSPQCPWRFEAWNELQFPTSLGGGKGTNFTPVFNHINTQDTPCDVLIYFTDAKGIFPDTKPTYPVMWLVKGKEPIPWGARIQLN
ncbi:MAG: hypothetical protein Ctma_0499 [Catillopecten margaritatus gill symbiont]|uniref:Sll7028 protein n=1 Tax=Catillopecten margaritatus gill symbiont TaxID=3083288 RepID=A0AAU6PFN1_9GAMM